jgi:hypothetical protein
MTTHLFIPDLQIKPGSPLAAIKWAALYACDKLPDVIIQAGDWLDFESLSSYDRGKKAAEGRRVKKDLDSAELSLKIFDLVMDEHWPRNTPRPRRVITLGNHCHRWNRYAEDHPELDGMVELPFERHGWETVPFLEPIEIDGFTYAHYFCRNANGQVMQSKSGQANARLQAQREMKSCVAGHTQGLSFHVQQLQDRRIYSFIAGSYHPLQDERYLSPQGANHWNGVLLLQGIHNGECSPIFVEADYLCRRYEGRTLEDFREHATDLELMRAPR